MKSESNLPNEGAPSDEPNASDADFVDESLSPLDFLKWPEKDRIAAEAVRDVLTDLNPARVEEHRALLRSLPDGIGDFEHLIEPTAYSLLAYGSVGLAALYKSSIDDALDAAHLTGRVLLRTALQDEVRIRGGVFFSQRYLPRDAYDRLCRTILGTCRNTELASEARRYISRIVSHYASDARNRHHLPMVVQGLTLTEKDGSPASRLVLDLMASAMLQISDELCNEAADLVAENRDEGDYQAFFEKHPALLDPLASSIVPRQALAEMWRTDFVIRRLDDQYVFVELEKPRDSLFTAYPQPSVVLSHALGQVLSWFAWVEDNIAYAGGHGFPNIHWPRGLIVIGRDKDLRPDQKRMLHLMNDLVGHRIDIVTYDDVVQNARNVVRNLTSSADVNG